MDRIPQPPRLLLIDGDVESLRTTASAFGACFMGAPLCVEARTGREGGELLRTQAFDVVIADVASLGDFGPRPEDAVARLVRLGRSALTLVLTEGGSISTAVAAMRAGAHDVIGRPLQAGPLAARIGQLAVRHGRVLPLAVDGIEAAPPTCQPAVLGMEPMPGPRRVLPMWRQEQRIIEDAIASFAGNVALAAAALELSPSTIYRKRQTWAEMEAERRGAA